MEIPTHIRQYMAFDKIEKDAKAGKEKIKSEVVSSLLSESYPGIKISTPKPTETLDEMVCLKWAASNLPKEDYEELFTKVFDPNKFAMMISHGKIDADKLPHDYKNVKPNAPRITVSHKD